MASGSAGGNGVYQYGGSAFPNQTYLTSNYWVDITFTPSTAATTTTAAAATTTTSRRDHDVDE